MPIASSPKFESPVSAAEFGVHVHDPLEHLQHCHQRIERSLTIVKHAVASLRLTDPVLRTEAAAALDYELALLQLLTELHTQDEEESLFPRLKRNIASHLLNELLPILESQHREKRALFQELAASLRSVTASAGLAQEEALGRLESLAGQLEIVFLPHMTLEDERLIPYCRQYLSQADLEEMRKEMRLRFETRKA